jgi:Fibronectin type III domain
LQWQLPHDNGAKITSHAVEMLFADGKDPDKVYTGANAACTVHGLEPKTSYTFRVYVTNACGDSPASEPMAVETKPSLPGPATNLTVKPDPSWDSIAATWEPGLDYGAPITCYNVRVVADVNEETCDILDPDAMRQSFNRVPVGSICAKKLASFTPYKISVQCINSVGSGPWVVAFGHTTPGPPSRPKPPKMLWNTEHSVAMIFAHQASTTSDSKDTDGKQVLPQCEPVYDVDGSIVQFELQMRQLSAAESDEAVASELLEEFKTVYQGPDISWLCSDLLLGTTYQFRARASNNIGASKWSKPVAASTKAQVPDPVGAGSIELVESTGSSLTVRWHKPAANGGARILRYVVDIKNTNQEHAPFDRAYAGPAMRRVITNLQPLCTYTVRIAAVNKVGRSQPSEVFFQTTGMPPAAPARLLLRSHGEDTDTAQLCLMWDAVKDPACTAEEYQLQRKQVPLHPGAVGAKTDASHFETIYTGTATEFDISVPRHVFESSRSVFMVRASNRYGTGPPSRTASFPGEQKADSKAEVHEGDDHTKAKNKNKQHKNKHKKNTNRKNKNSSGDSDLTESPFITMMRQRQKEQQLRTYMMYLAGIVISVIAILISLYLYFT